MHTDPSPLVLERARGTALKLSLNVLHKDPNLTIMTLPIEGIELVQEQLDAFMGKHTFRSWYDQRADGSWHPCAWWNHRDDADFPIDAAFHTDTLTLGLSGALQLVFERQEPAEEGDDPIPAAKITSIRLKPTPGGVTMLSLHVQVRPGLGKDNLLLQEHQYRPITITLGDTKVAPKKAKQQSLPLEPAKDTNQQEGNTREESGHGAPLSAEQIEELQRTRQSDSAGEPPDEKLAEACRLVIVDQKASISFLQNELLIGYNRAARLLEAMQVLQIVGPTEPNGERAVLVPVGWTPPTEIAMDPELEADMTKFEADARESLAAFADRNNRGVWDGRSERVKHQDEQRELEAPKFPPNTNGEEAA